MFGLTGILVGILLFMVGIFLIFFMPASTKHQPESMAWTGIVLGIIFLVVGAALIFF